MKMLLLAASCALAAGAKAPAKPRAPGAEAQKALAAGIALYEKADFEAALQAFDKAVALFPDWKTALGHRAMCRWNLGDRLNANRDAFVATHLRPNSAESSTARGLARFVLKDYAAAEKDFAEALKLDPEAAQAYYGAGSVASAQGQLGRALQNLGEAVRANGRFAAAYLVRGTVQERRKDFAAAIRDFDRVLEINPRFTWARFYRGKCRREIKDYREALSDFDEFIAENPDYAEALYLRSNVRFLTRDYPGAVADLSAVIAQDPRRGLAYSNRGLARAQLGDRLGALADLKRAQELLPSRRDQLQAAIDGVEASAEAKPERRPAAWGLAAPAGEAPAEPAFVTSEEGRARKKPARKAAAVDDDMAVPESSGKKPAPAPVVRERDPAPSSPKRSSGLDRWDEASPVESEGQVEVPDEARPEPARKASGKAGPAAPEPAERHSGREEALLIE
ncbi:MAG: tetratricopeptide repeat protein [Elusimicrobia bacterium]|nr:tetratricopeptide repeat protein [Elusimicrobiota bacterium]